jgi:lambda repressor-like predicted transcriptional regulator
MRIDVDKACVALNMLLEGMSLRATSRMTGIDRNTLGDLLLLVGERCEQFSAAVIQDVDAGHVQADEIWSFVGMKEKTRNRLNRSQDFGDSWTWIAVEDIRPVGSRLVSRARIQSGRQAQHSHQHDAS